MTCYDIQRPSELVKLLGTPLSPSMAPLGEILLHLKMLESSQLELVLKQQNQSNKRLGVLLLEQGFVTPEQLYHALAMKLGILRIRLSSLEVSESVISRVPSHLALQFNIMPLAYFDGRLFVAMENPIDGEGLNRLRFACDFGVEALMSSAREISIAVGRHYSNAEESEALQDMSVRQGLTNKTTSADVPRTSHRPVVRLLNAILLQGLMRGASDINIQPTAEIVRVYYRVDGKLQLIRTLDRDLLKPLVSRAKIISGMDISERRIPQDGHAQLKRGDVNVDLRVSVIPTINGESVVIRVLDQQHRLLHLSELGLPEADCASMLTIINKSHGMILVAGPTGSGKTTTLYALMNEIRKSHRHILSVEDPVEYDISGIEQVQVSSRKGVTFSSALRHFLRHDPDVIMVGEIRDAETATIANRAALTGHLLLSTLHTNSAPATITRLLNMGVERFLLSDTLLAIISQRLVRLNCVYCKTKESISPSTRKKYSLNAEIKFYRGRGCEQCHQSGYSGRRVVAEILTVTSEVAALIAQGVSTIQLNQYIEEQGVKNLWKNALALAAHGETSLEEVFSICAD